MNLAQEEFKFTWKEKDLNLFQKIIPAAAIWSVHLSISSASHIEARFTM